MAHATRWTCPACARVLGAVDRRGTLVVDSARVMVRRGPSILVICPGCHAERRWVDAGELGQAG